MHGLCGTGPGEMDENKNIFLRISHGNDIVKGINQFCDK